LPAQADVNLQPSIDVQPTSISPTGLGGFVGINDSPAGEILGRRIEATVAIGLKAATANDIAATVRGAINALVAADRSKLVGQGLLRLALSKVGDPAPGEGGAVQQQVSVGVLYEYLKIPVGSEGVIKTIPLTIQLQQ